MRPYEHGGDIYGGTPPRWDFSVSVNPLGMPPAAVEAIRLRTEEDVRYPDPACRELRAALSGVYGRSAEQILCGGGASDLILRLCLCLQPRRTLVTAPTFSEYARSAALCGSVIAEHRLRPENDFSLTESFLDDVTPQTDLVFLCNPNNPTARLCPPALLERLCERCAASGACLVVDECFLPFTDAPSALPYLEKYPRLLLLRAFTKIYAMAGLRLGVLLCADAALLARIAQCGAAWSVSTVAQRAGLAALTQKEWLPRTRRLVAQERQVLSRQLEALGLYVVPGAGNFMLIHSPRPLCEPLRLRGVQVRECDNFTGLDAHYFRIGIRTPQENRVLLDTLREVLHG